MDEEKKTRAGVELLRADHVARQASNAVAIESVPKQLDWKKMDC